MYLDHAREAGPRLLEDSTNVLAALLGLVGYATLDQVALDVGGNLAGDKDVGAGDDGLRLSLVVSQRRKRCFAGIRRDQPLQLST